MASRPVLDAIRSDVWGEHAHNNADQIRAMLAELPEVSMAYLDPADWATLFAKYIEDDPCLAGADGQTAWIAHYSTAAVNRMSPWRAS